MTNQRDLQGQWKPGVSRNPAGRPKGARNKATVVRQAMDGDDAGQMARAVIALAKAGDVTALKVCLDRICPVDRPSAFDLPRIETRTDMVRAVDALLQAVAAGELTPRDAERLARVVEAAGRSLAPPGTARPGDNHGTTVPAALLADPGKA